MLFRKRLAANIKKSIERLDDRLINAVVAHASGVFGKIYWQPFGEGYQTPMVGSFDFELYS